MNRFGLRFHHFGLAVRRPDSATTFLSGLGYRVGESIFDPEQNVNLIMNTHDQMPSVEIIYPTLGEGKTPVDGLIVRHPDGVVYHPCFETSSIEQSVGESQASGARLQC